MRFPTRTIALAAGLCVSWSLAAFVAAAEPGTGKPGSSVLEHFITRRGDKLMDGDKEFRFQGANMPGLVVPYDYTLWIPERMTLPTPWEQEDGVKTLAQMNLRVARTWCLPMRKPEEKAADGGMTWHYVQGPGQLNDKAFRVIDNLLALGNRYGVRFILSLSAAQDHYLGGFGTFAAHRGKRRDQFWTDPQLRQDYKDTARLILERRNTVTGVPYKLDKAVLAWQFGNEMQQATEAWCAEMAAYFKSLDPNHLIIHTWSSHALDPQRLDPNIDIYNRHYYSGGKKTFAELCREDRRKIKGKRPFVVGEYGPYIDGRHFTEENVVAKHREFLAAVEESGTAGALIWSMYFHHRNGGFYWHQIFTYPSVWSYHWPGFPSAEAQKEQQILAALRESAFRIQGLAVPPVPVPDPPQLLPIGDVPLLSWRGSAGATGYDIQRAPASDGPWSVVARNVCDADVAYRPLWSDQTARAGQTWFYRATARNASGASKPSAPVGPVKVRGVCLVDEWMDFSRVQAKSEGLSLNNRFNAIYAEYLFRVRGDKGQWVVYQTPAPMTSLGVWAWFKGKPVDPSFQVSADGRKYVDLTTQRCERAFRNPPDGVMGRERRTLVEFRAAVPPGNRHVKILWNGPAELDRVEIVHPGAP